MESLNTPDASDLEQLADAKKTLDTLQALLPPGTNEVAD